jgi:hypothetical protein
MASSDDSGYGAEDGEASRGTFHFSLCSQVFSLPELLRRAAGVPSASAILQRCRVIRAHI